uniref:hydroperoxide isomerase ALOXE3-like n=1 Tax=Pristiophorus japonicus TaxID=55135 RepID=UPI00398F0A17
MDPGKGPRHRVVTQGHREAQREVEGRSGSVPGLQKASVRRGGPAEGAGEAERQCLRPTKGPACAAAMGRESKKEVERNQKVDTYDMIVSNDIGEILLVKIEKRKYWIQDDWYCKYITLKTPTGDYVEFSCYRWIIDHKEIELRDGQARLPRNDQTQIARQHRHKELEERQKSYRSRIPGEKDCSRRHQAYALEDGGPQECIQTPECDGAAFVPGSSQLFW